TGRPVAAVPAAWMLGTHNLDFSPDGRFVYGPSSGDVVLSNVELSKWETATGREVMRFAFSPDAPRRGDVRAFRLSPDGRTLIAVSSPSTVGDPILLARWDTESGKTLSEKQMEQGRGLYEGVALSPDGRWLSTSDAVYPTEVGPAGNTLPREGYSLFNPGTFSADGRLMLRERYPPPKTENAWQAGVFEVVTGLKVAELALGSPYCRLAFHPDGRSVVVVGSKALTFYDLAAGKLFAERKAPEPETEGPRYAFTRTVRYFPDGTRLVTGESDTTALVWEVPARPKAAKELTDKERAAAWEALGSADGAKGWAAVW